MTTNSGDTPQVAQYELEWVLDTKALGQGDGSRAHLAGGLNRWIMFASVLGSPDNDDDAKNNNYYCIKVSNKTYE